MNTPVNILIGRFQPITTGHIKCAQYAEGKKGIPTVLCMIDTPDERVDERHPFPSSMLIPIYKELFSKNSLIIDLILVKNANIVDIAAALNDKGYAPQSWTCGTDRVDAYKKMAEKYAEKANLPEDFEVLEIKRSDKDESATKLRAALKAGNKTEFFKSFPAISLPVRLKMDIYKALRDQILSLE